ncbi:lysophospholipase L1-like esterase [Streptomyces sp. CZ24]|nr:lysophospholipase L1-like esterase [Streptomyces sp. CZ24]
MTTRVACLGDSLTRAQVSVDYLDLLERRRPAGDVRLARFGVNGDFAYHLLQRLDAVVADPPEVITVLIGTNDARASLAGYPVEQVMKRKRLPERPSAGWFQQCLGAVVARLRAETDARIGLLSPPVLGQEPDGPAARASLAYSRMIAEVAAAEEVAYLPLHERQTEETAPGGRAADSLPGGDAGSRCRRSPPARRAAPQFRRDLAPARSPAHDRPHPPEQPRRRPHRRGHRHRSAGPERVAGPGGRRAVRPGRGVLAGRPG